MNATTQPIPKTALPPEDRSYRVVAAIIAILDFIVCGAFFRESPLGFVTAYIIGAFLGAAAFAFLSFAVTYVVAKNGWRLFPEDSEDDIIEARHQMAAYEREKK